MGGMDRVSNRGMVNNAQDVLRAAVAIAGGPGQLASYLGVDEVMLRAELDGAETLPTDAMLALIDLVIADPGFTIATCRP